MTFVCFGISYVLGESQPHSFNLIPMVSLDRIIYALLIFFNFVILPYPFSLFHLAVFPGLRRVLTTRFELCMFNFTPISKSTISLACGGFSDEDASFFLANFRHFPPFFGSGEASLCALYGVLVFEALAT